MPHDSPFMRLALNFVFSTLVSLLIASLIARTFLARGTPGLLLFGCGVIVWGFGGLASSIASYVDVSRGVTVHNVCVWLSASCHLIGVGLLLRPKQAVNATGPCLAAAYSTAVSIVLLVLFATLAGGLPTFFVQGGGGTPLRYWVLGTAIAMFVLTAALLRLVNRRHSTAFAVWYSLALVATAIGLFGVTVQTAVGSPVNWAGRTTQYLGGVYMLIAALASARETRQWGIPLEQALSEARQRYEELFALAADGILVHEAFNETSLGNFTEANPAVSALLGYTLEEMRTLAPNDITAQDGRPPVPIGAKPINHQAVIRYERILIAKDGRRIPVEINTRFFHRQGHLMAMSVLRDNIERRQAEEQIARLYYEAQQEIERRKEVELRLRHANEDLDAFVSAISHDLQSPMNGVSCMVELLQEEYDGKLGPDVDLYLTHILNGVARSRRMITDLLDYSKAGQDDTLEKGSIELAKVLEYTELNLAVTIQKSQAVITHDALPEVEGNFMALAHLFQNLIENALKYRAQEVPRIHIAADRKKDSWELCISDNGIGIDPKYAEMIFGVFRRVHGAQYEGTGIGLSLCKKIVERHGGRIWVESRLGEGARFYFTLPMPSRLQQRSEGQHNSPGSLGGIRVLLVDDLEAGRFVKARALSKAGALVRQASTGREALDIAETEDFDLALLDIHLPDMLGMQLSRQLQRNPAHSALPVIYTSAREPRLDIDKNARFLHEPVDAAQLIVSVQEVVVHLKTTARKATENEPGVAQTLGTVLLCL